jgi:HEAT repeats
MSIHRVGLLLLLVLVAVPGHIRAPVPVGLTRSQACLREYVQLGNPRDPSYRGRPLDYWRAAARSSGIRFTGLEVAVLADGPDEIYISPGSPEGVELVPLLLALAADVNSAVRRVAARGLGTYHGGVYDTVAAGGLVFLIGDPDVEVRWEAARALSGFGKWVLGQEETDRLVAPVLDPPAEQPDWQYPIGVAPLARNEVRWIVTRSYPLVLALNPDVTDDDLAVIGTFRQIDALWLRDARITDAGLAHLQHLDNLRVLHLEGTEVSDGGLAVLAQLPALRAVHLRGSRVTPAGANRLRESAPHLQVTD